jgi:hypothetical protein
VIPDDGTIPYWQDAPDAVEVIVGYDSPEDGEEPPTAAIAPDPEPEPWHGTAGGYTNHGCRCDRCRVAHAAAKSYADRRKAFEREGLALIESETNTVEGDIDPRGNPTVRDFVRCKPSETYSCVRGGYWTHDRLSNGHASARIRHGYGACGTVCPHCAPWWASERLKILTGMLFSTEEGPHAVWMLRHEWDERGAEIREAYTAEAREDQKVERFYSVWYAGDFEHIVVLTPGPTDGSQPVSGREVAEIILASPGNTGGKHRYFGAPLRRPRKPSEWKSFHFPGYAARDVSSTVEFTLGKTFREDDESDTWPIHVSSKSLLGVTDEDVMKHRHTVEELRDERRHWDEVADELAALLPAK